MSKENKQETNFVKSDIREQILQEALQQQEQLVKDRRYLHQHPGTGFAIAETVAYVKQELLAMGYTPQDCGKAGVVALAGGEKTGRVFLIRADMDALPMREESGLTFSAQNGNMHACGHDLHTAMLLGAARLLKLHEAELSGTVKLMFQPAEEIFEGAKDMIQAGVLESPTVDAAMMLHVTAGMPLPSGTAVVMAGGVSASACDSFEIYIQGKGCHGSMPEQGIDPILSAAHMVLALQEIQTREIHAGGRVTLTFGMMQAGNTANVIPDTALLKGTLRTLDEGVRNAVKDRMQAIVTGIGAAYRTKVELRFVSECPTLQNNADLSNQVTRYARELFGKQGALAAEELAIASEKNGQKQSGGGSEDFANVSQEIPAIMVALAAGQPQEGYQYPQHHPKVLFDETVLVKGCALYAYTAMRWLAEQE